MTSKLDRAKEKYLKISERQRIISVLLLLLGILLLLFSIYRNENGFLHTNTLVAITITVGALIFQWRLFAFGLNKEGLDKLPEEKQRAHLVKYYRRLISLQQPTVIVAFSIVILIILDLLLSETAHLFDLKERIKNLLSGMIIGLFMYFITIKADRKANKEILDELEERGSEEGILVTE